MSVTVVVPTPAYRGSVRSRTGMVFVSGQVPINSDGIIPNVLEEQIQIVLHNLEAELNSHGLGLSDMLHATVILKHVADLDRFDKVWKKVLGAKVPARTTFVALIPRERMMVEINCIAEPGGGRRGGEGIDPERSSPAD